MVLGFSPGLAPRTSEESRPLSALLAFAKIRHQGESMNQPYTALAAYSNRLAMTRLNRLLDGQRTMCLGTIRPNGYPRIHSIRPFLIEGNLFAFLDPTSSKAEDLERDGRFTLHSLLTDSDGISDEFQFSGRARRLDRSESLMGIILQLSSPPPARYALFQFLVERCLTSGSKAIGPGRSTDWEQA